MGKKGFPLAKDGRCAVSQPSITVHFGFLDAFPLRIRINDRHDGSSKLQAALVYVVVAFHANRLPVRRPAIKPMWRRGTGMRLSSLGFGGHNASLLLKLV